MDSRCGIPGLACIKLHVVALGICASGSAQEGISGLMIAYRIRTLLIEMQFIGYRQSGLQQPGASVVHCRQVLHDEVIYEV